MNYEMDPSVATVETPKKIRKPRKVKINDTKPIENDTTVQLKEIICIEFIRSSRIDKLYLNSYKG